MKKVVYLITAIVFLGLFSVSSMAATYGGGNGTAANPYRIGTLSHWQTLTNTPADWDKHFVLTANLNFGGLTQTPVGNNTTPFTGSLDGQGHSIQNVVINQPSSNYVGLFGVIGVKFSDDFFGQIQNLGVENITVIGNGEYASVGGLAGFVGNSEIRQCFVTGSIRGNFNVGGFVGDIWGGKIIDSSVIANVQGGSVVGQPGYTVGFAGSSMNGGNISRCFSVCSITSLGEKAGFCDFTDSVVWSFYDSQVANLTPSYDAGMGLQTIVMQNVETYLRAYWDFVGEVKNGTEDIWFMPPEGGYPILAWQAANRFVLANDQMLDATPITVGASVNGTTVGATGLDITTNGYNDLLDVWYAFDCTTTGKYTITLTGVGFDTTLGVFDAKQNEVAFNDEFFGGKSRVILNGKTGKRYYIRVAGVDGQSGSFTLNLAAGATQAIQGDINYDGKVNLIDLSTLAENWMLGA